MAEIYRAQYVTLQVRVSNLVAQRLYREFLGFEVGKREAKYYADGEDAHTMRKDLKALIDDVTELAAENQAEAPPDEAKLPHDEEPLADDVNRLNIKVGRALGVGNLVERDERAG